MSPEISDWVKSAISEVGSKSYELDPTAAKKVQHDARDIYVEGTPRSWWMSLKNVHQTFDSTDTPLSRIIPGGHDRCFLIPETEMEQLPVFDIPTADLMDVIGDCPFFEYYLLGKDLSWLVIESDHNQFFLCKRD